MSIDDHLRTITEGARCFLATQHQQVIGSIVELEGEQLARSAPAATTEPADPILIGPIADIRDGVAVLDEHQLAEAARLELRRGRLGKEARPRASTTRIPNAGLTTLHPAPVAAAPAAAPAAAASRRPGACTKRWRCPRSSWSGDPEERLYASAPIDTDDGPVVVIHEQDLPEEGEPAPGS